MDYEFELALYMCIIWYVSGSIQFRHWKPLPFSSVTEDQHMTVEQIFSDVFSAATVRILLSRSVLDTDTAVLHAVLVIFFKKLLLNFHV